MIQKQILPFYLFVLALLIFNSSCKTYCDPGFEGENCQTESRAKYLGNFQGIQNCSSDITPVTITIEGESTDITRLRITNIYGYGFTTNGIIEDDGRVTLPSQNFGSGTISGSLVLENNKLKMNYILSGSGVTLECSWLQN